MVIALIHGAKIIALMGLELIENKGMFDEIVQQHSHIKGSQNDDK